jgi:hypothetical protein
LLRFRQPECRITKAIKQLIGFGDLLEDPIAAYACIGVLPERGVALHVELWQHP